MIENLIEIQLYNDDDFLKIKETLTRIGISSKKENKLFQSCHILHKQGKFYIVHFKELFMLDGKPTNFSEEDKGRRNTIVSLLHEWKLLKITDETTNKIVTPRAPLSQIKIIAFKDKGDWELCSKYTIGKIKRSQ